MHMLSGLLQSHSWEICKPTYLVYHLQGSYVQGFWQTFLLPALKHTWFVCLPHKGQLYDRYVLLCYTLHRPDHNVKSSECYNASLAV